jgi:glycosyltransferase involved in cell wall biosynthesis
VEKPDAILCGVDEVSLGFALLASRIIGGRVFAVIEDPPFTTRYERIKGIRGSIEKSLRTRFLRNLLDRCAGLFCFIEKEVLEGYGLRKVPLYQMMNAASSVAVDWMKKNGPGKNSPETYTVGLVGALTPAQGIESLLEIVSLAKQQNGNVRLRLIGPMEPGYSETFQRRIKELKLDSCTEVTGWLPYPKMLDQLQECSVGVYCTPSTAWYRAAHPLKICEYLALAKPMVAWDYPGIRRMMADGRFGFLIPPGDNLAFAQALVYLKNPEIRNSISEEIRLAVKKDWNNQHWYGKVLQIMKNPGIENKAGGERDAG